MSDAVMIVDTIICIVLLTAIGFLVYGADGAAWGAIVACIGLTVVHIQGARRRANRAARGQS